MANIQDFSSTALRIGEKYGGSVDPRELFLDLYGGEVLKAYNNAVQTEPLHITRNISGGRSAKFPITGRVAAHYHQPGTALNGQTTNQSERIIGIDDKLVADIFIPDIDEAINHYDYRGIYSNQCGVALAEQYDTDVFRTAFIASGITDTLMAATDGHPAGTRVIQSTTEPYVANMGTSATALKTALRKVAESLDKKNVPKANRYQFLRPAQWYLFWDEALSSSVFNRDWGGTNSPQGQTLPPYCGFTLRQTNLLPTDNYAGVVNERGIANGTSYACDMSHCISLGFQGDAIGTVRLLGLKQQMETSVRYQGTLVVSSFALGHGILRPECAWAFTDSGYTAAN